MERTGTSVPLHLSVDPWWELAAAIAYGRVDDGLPRRQLIATSDERVALVLHAPGRGPVIGFIAREPHDIEVDAITTPAFHDGPTFDVPALTLTRASAADVLRAVQRRFDRHEPTADAMHFHLGFDGDQDVETRLGHFRFALEAGQMKALFALGYTLVEAGRPREAYDALRRYTELTPHNAWAWCWLGKACAALGERDEAVKAFRTAIARERAGSFETEASELLAELERA